MKRENQDQNGDGSQNNKRQRKANEEEVRLLIPSKVIILK